MCRLAVLTATLTKEVAMKTMVSRLSRYRKLVAQVVAALGLMWMTMPVPFAGLREKLTHWAVGGVEEITPEQISDGMYPTNGGDETPEAPK